MIPLSVLDLVPVPEGATPSDAFANSRDLARHADDWGYTRYWLAEHHNMVGIASAATAVVIGNIAGATRRIRVGSGGIMLPNHSPLVIAEQFGTLESLYPGRIDLGVGRAPGTDQMTFRAMRRDPSGAERFPQDVVELQTLLGPAQPNQMIRAVPGAGLNVPVWILGSSLYGAQLAALLGLPYAPVALALGAAVLVMVLALDRFTPEKAFEPAAERKSVVDHLRGEWSSTAAGVVAAVLILGATMQGGYLGFSGAVLAFVGWMSHLIGVPFSPVPVITDDIVWRAALIIGVLPGGFVAKLLSTKSKEAALHPVPKVLDVRALVKTTGMITLMTSGALIGGGCTTGAFISAWPTLSVGSFAMSLTFFATSMLVSNARIWMKTLDLPAAQAIGDRVYD